MMLGLGCGGDGRARPCPGGLSRRRGLVSPAGGDEGELGGGVWSPGGTLLNQKKQSTKIACALPSVPNQAAQEGRRGMARPRLS